MRQAQGVLSAQEIMNHAEVIESLLREERLQTERLSRMARASRTTDTILGGVAGAGVGVVGSLALVSGVIPGFEGMAALGPSLPIAFGATLAGLGSLVGTFVDLNAVANVWRR
jgi:hypothetical protein